MHLAATQGTAAPPRGSGIDPRPGSAEPGLPRPLAVSELRCADSRISALKRTLSWRREVALERYVVKVFSYAHCRRLPGPQRITLRRTGALVPCPLGS